MPIKKSTKKKNIKKRTKQKTKSTNQTDNVLDQKNLTTSDTTKATKVLEEKTNNFKSKKLNQVAQKNRTGLLSIFNQKTRNKLVSVVVSLLLSGGIFFVALNTIPDLYRETDDAKAEQEAEEREKQARTESEARRIKQEKLDKQSKNLDLEKEQTRFLATIEALGQEYQFELVANKEWGQQNYENFLRLTDFGTYNDIKMNLGQIDEFFPNALVLTTSIDENKDEAALIDPIADERWLVEPEFDFSEDTGPVVTNEPKFRNNNYVDYDQNTGEVTYKKGSIAFQRPITGGEIKANFFIVPSDIRLTSQYTIFGTLTPDSITKMDEVIQAILNTSQNTGESENDQDENNTPELSLTLKELKIQE